MSDTIGLIVLVSAAVGFVTLAKTYRRRAGERRENMLLVSMRDGCIGGLVAGLILFLGWIVYAWLAGEL